MRWLGEPLLLDRHAQWQKIKPGKINECTVRQDNLGTQTAVRLETAARAVSSYQRSEAFFRFKMRARSVFAYCATVIIAGVIGIGNGAGHVG